MDPDQIINFLTRGEKLGMKSFQKEFGIYPRKLLDKMLKEKLILKGYKDGLVSWSLKIVVSGNSKYVVHESDDEISFIRIEEDLQ